MVTLLGWNFDKWYTNMQCHIFRLLYLFQRNSGWYSQNCRHIMIFVFCIHTFSWCTSIGTTTIATDVAIQIETDLINHRCHQRWINSTRVRHRMMIKLWNTTATDILVMRRYILVVIGGAKCRRRRCGGGGGGHEFARPFEQSIDQMSDFITALGVNHPGLMVVHIFCYYLWFWNDKRGIRCRSCWHGTNMTDLWGRHRESYPCHPFYKDYQCTFLQKEIHESARRGLEPLLLVSSISTKIKNHNDGSCRWWRRASGYFPFLSCVAVTQPERNGQWVLEMMWHSLTRIVWKLIIDRTYKKEKQWNCSIWFPRRRTGTTRRRRPSKHIPRLFHSSATSPLLCNE